MPLYEYECQQCHRRLEKIQKFSDAPLSICPHCGGELERTLTAPAIQFKGSGWYKDLYSSPKPANSGTSGTPSAAGSDGSSTPASGGEAKPAAAAPVASAPASSTSSPGGSAS